MAKPNVSNYVVIFGNENTALQPSEISFTSNEILFNRFYVHYNVTWNTLSSKSIFIIKIQKEYELFLNRNIFLNACFSIAKCRPRKCWLSYLSLLFGQHKKVKIYIASTLSLTNELTSSYFPLIEGIRCGWRYSFSFRTAVSIILCVGGIFSVVLDEWEFKPAMIFSIYILLD